MDASLIEICKLTSPIPEWPDVAALIRAAHCIMHTYIHTDLESAKTLHLSLYHGQ